LAYPSITAHAELTLALTNPGTTAGVYGVQAVNTYGTASSIVADPDWQQPRRFLLRRRWRRISSVPDRRD
jgi:hypothetical protein